MKLRLTLTNVFRNAQKYLDRQELIELYRTQSRKVKRAALQKLSHLLLSGRVKIINAHYVLPNDVSSAIARFWGIKGDLKAIDLKQLAQESKSPDILASLAENPDVGLLAAKNKHCPWKAVAKALCNTPPDNVDTYPLEEAYLNESIEQVRAVIWSHRARMNNILKYISANNVALYHSLRLRPIYTPTIVKK